MKLSDEVLYGPLDVYSRVVALERVYGITNSYVRKRKQRVTLKAVGGQIESARRVGASEEEIRSKVRRAITGPPNADPERAKEVEQRFLQ